MILAYAVLAGLLTALLRTVLTRRPLQPPLLQDVWLVALAYLPQWLFFRNAAVGGVIPDLVAATSLVVSQVLLLLFAWQNRQLPGMWLLGAGAVMNFAVITLNGGFMPIFPEVVSDLVPHADGTWEPGHRLWLTKDIVLLSAETRLPWLSDRFLLPEWAPARAAYSLGDVAIALGTFRLLWSMGGNREKDRIRTTVGEQAQAII
jgi:hypothetical protein